MRRVLKAWKEAERVLSEFGVEKPMVPVDRIAKKYATVVLSPLDGDVSGVLVPVADNEWTIIVNSNHPEVRQRFTIAHELGHLLMHSYDTPHADRSFKFRDAKSSEGTAIDEIQANQFAAELLMPRAMLLRDLNGVRLDHAGDDEEFEALARRLAKRYGVSKQAMTIRISSLLA